ncbi:MAG: hypothetical protein M3256_15510 [Actinomycetota bacterium]|nr:hypothetical protein [Actinomycetota bacterium]
MTAAVVVVLAQMLADEGGGPRVNVNIPWQVVAWAIAGVVALLAVAVVVLLILGRRPGRLPVWRQKRLAIEETMLGEGPRRALVRLRLQLDDAIAVAKSAAAMDGADIGDLRLLVHRFETAAGRMAGQIDSLLDGGAVSAPKRVVDAVRARVRDLEAVAASLSDAAGAVVAGSAALEIDALTDDVRSQLELVDARTDALRELSGRPEAER